MAILGCIIGSATGYIIFKHTYNVPVNHGGTVPLCRFFYDCKMIGCIAAGGILGLFIPIV